MKKNLLIIIPARSGSTRVKNKNLRKVGGKSLIEIKIKSCLQIKNASVVVSTNSIKIARLSKSYGAQVPYLRSKKYSTSKASTIACVLDLMRFFLKNKVNIPEYIAVCPPTNPFLKAESIKGSFNKLLKNKDLNSVLGYTVSTDHPFSFISIVKEKIKFNIIKFQKKTYSQFERTQDWPKSYIGSAAIKISKRSYFMKHIQNKTPNLNLKTFDLSNALGFCINEIENFDINREFDVKLANFLFKLKTTNNY